MRDYKPVDTSLRPVPGGFIQRVNIGDRWQWFCYDENREPIPSLGWKLKTRAQAEYRIYRHVQDKKKGLV